MKKRNSQKKRHVPFTKRAALSPEEFAAKFGRQKIWTYRQLYAGRIKAITGFGHLMIPSSEIDTILNSAALDAMGATKQQTKAKP